MSFQMINDLPTDFDGDEYLAINPDVAAAGMNPIQHYMQYGRKEGRAYKSQGNCLTGDRIPSDSVGQPNVADLQPVVEERWLGFCPICQQKTEFVSRGTWYRDTLTCTTCNGGSVPRERALALVLEEALPNWRRLRIHESSPVWRGISLKMRNEATNYTATQYFPDRPFGTIIDNVRNEDLQRLTFETACHDLFVSLDVFEHIPDPKAALSEIYRTLRPGGTMLSTFPVRKWQVNGLERRTDFGKDGRIIHLKEPEYHGNPVDPKGSIVTIDYGYDLHQLFSDWTSFDVRVYRFSDRRHGILGEYTDVILCKKSCNA